MSKLSPACRVLPFVVLGGVVACGSREPEARPVEIQDPMQFDATPETRAQLGIERWGLISVTPDETFVHGYDAQHRMTLQWHRKVGFDGPGARSIETDLAGEHGAASMRISVVTQDAEDGEGLETKSVVEENTFETNDQAQRTVERVRADIGMAVPVFADGAAPATSLVKQSQTIGLLDTKNEGTTIVKGCDVTTFDKCSKEEGVKILKQICAQLLADCNKQVIAAEQAVLIQNAACAHKAKNTSSVSRTWCSISSSESCTRDNAAVDECDKAVKEAKASADASGDCQTNRRANTDCADAGGTWDRYHDALEKQQACDREIRDSNSRYDKCFNDCMTFIMGGASDSERRQFCSGEACSNELGVDSTGKSLDSCKANR